MQLPSADDCVDIRHRQSALDVPVFQWFLDYHSYSQEGPGTSHLHPPGAREMIIGCTRTVSLRQGEMEVDPRSV